MILFDTLSIALAAFALYQVTELSKQVKALEARKPEPEKRVSVSTPNGIEKTEAPKAGTVAAKAIQPVVYLSQVSHKTIVLDNGGLEWEGKI